MAYIWLSGQVCEHCPDCINVTGGNRIHQMSVRMMTHHQRTNHLLQAGISHCAVTCYISQTQLKIIYISQHSDISLLQSPITTDALIRHRPIIGRPIIGA